MKKVIVLGASGMLGSMVTHVLGKNDDISVTATVRSKKIIKKIENALPVNKWIQYDAFKTDSTKLEKVIENQDWVINAIGVTKPLIHEDNPNEIGYAIRINCVFPFLLSKKAHELGINVIQIATDCVFSGRTGGYYENDAHDANDVYGKTKSLGEVPGQRYHHLRCSIIGPEAKENKFLLEWFRRLPQRADVHGYTNHIWNGVSTLHFARIVRGIIKSDIELPRIQHIVPSGQLTKAEILRLFAKIYCREDITITDIEADQSINRTLRTASPAINKLLWNKAGYTSPPKIPSMIFEMAEYEYPLSDKQYWAKTCS
jgi:dTDP-4-dehydrorhamnose reductase